MWFKNDVLSKILIKFINLIDYTIIMYDIVNFSKYDLNFLIELYNKGKLTRKTQTSYRSGMSYYFGTWFLCDDVGLIKVVDKGKNGEHVWSLTDKGKKFVELIIKIRGLLNEG